jgi:GH24 family phage-related lysozyme (muramidase)
MDQWSFTAPFEGKIPHIYKDHRGFLTVGVGFLLPDIASLKNYAWTPNLSEAQADFLTVKDLFGVHTAEYYRKFTRARMSEDLMRETFDRKVLEFRKQIQGRWNLNNQPAPVQIALVDMAFQLGAGRLAYTDGAGVRHKATGLAGYGNLFTAVMARDWTTAAKESFRKDAQPARNEATKALFLSVV